MIASALMEMTRDKGNRANFVVDRKSLINQTSRMFDSYGIDHGVIQADHPRFRPSVPIQVCSIQTLARREWPESNVDVFDEAHILHKEHKARMAAGSSIVIGLTATPFTRGLAKYFDHVVNVTTTRQLIKDGWLAPYRIFSCAEPNMDGVEVKANGEWDEKQTSGRALEVVGDVVKEYMLHGESRKFICSAVDTTHVEELQRQFVANGINAATYTYKDSDDDRAEVLDEFRKADSSIRGLITVTAASRGFDQPDVSCIIMARPLRKSLAEHIQLFGRGLRIAQAKADCTVLDHSGNAARFFSQTEDFFDNGASALDDGKPKTKSKQEKPEIEAIKCPSCGHLHRPMPFCPHCGHAYPKRQTVVHVPGTLKKLIAGGFHKELVRDLWPQVCGYVLERKSGQEAAKQAVAIYASLTGGVPRGAWFDSTKPVAPSQEVRNRILHNQIKFARRRR